MFNVSSLKNDFVERINIQETFKIKMDYVVDINLFLKGKRLCLQNLAHKVCCF